MKSILILAICVGVAYGSPARYGRQETQSADVIPVSNPITPVVLPPSSPALESNEILEPRTNETLSESPPTTEKLPEQTPSLVPTVVDISSTPAPSAPSNSTTPIPEEEDEESDEEEGSDEEEDEEEEEDNEEEDNEDEEEDEEEEDNEEDDINNNSSGEAKKSLKSSSKTKKVLDFNEIESIKKKKNDLTEFVIITDNKNGEDDEEITTLSPPLEENKPQPSLINIPIMSNLQTIPARSPTNEDDEIDIENSPGGFVIIKETA